MECHICNLYINIAKRIFWSRYEQDLIFPSDSCIVLCVMVLHTVVFTLLLLFYDLLFLWYFY